MPWGWEGVGSYLPGAVQPVRDFQELSLCSRADVTAVPFQCDAVNHHETEARAGDQHGPPVQSAGDCVPGTQKLHTHREETPAQL